MGSGRVGKRPLQICRELGHIRGQSVDSGDISNRIYHLFLLVRKDETVGIHRHTFQMAQTTCEAEKGWLVEVEYV